MSKSALLIGCNYPGTDNELRGCVNDVYGMKDLLTEVYEFPEDNIEILIDTDSSFVSPTGANIKKALKKLVQSAAPGDVVLFHFSGHGTQIPGDDGEEEDMMDEAIVPTDMNVITDDDLREIISKLSEDVKFTMIADCCHSGTMLDHSAVQIEGDKDGGTGGMSQDVIGGLVGALFKDIDVGEFTVGGDDDRFKNRALPTNQLLSFLSSSLGQQVIPGNIRSSMVSVFGGSASSKAVNYMQITQGLLTQIGKPELASAVGGMMGMLGGGGGGGGGGIGSFVGGILGGGEQGGASTDEGSSQPPKPGQKPDATLHDDKGILISGCQSFETSADACPSGDPSRAFGALSNAIQTVVKQHQSEGKNPTFREVVTDVRNLLSKGGYSQNPSLECSDANADTPFITRE